MNYLLSLYTQAFRQVCRPRKQVTYGILHGIPRERERYLTILYRALENTEVNTINATYTRRMMGSLDVIPSNIQRHLCILAGCMFYGME